MLNWIKNKREEQRKRHNQEMQECREKWRDVIGCRILWRYTHYTGDGERTQIGDAIVKEVSEKLNRVHLSDGKDSKWYHFSRLELIEKLEEANK